MTKSIYIKNKYQKWYDSIILNAQSSFRSKLKYDNPDFIYYERHHIIPKCMGGSNNDDNLVLLTLKEHCVCHRILAAIHGGGLWYAFHIMYSKRKDMSYHTLEIAKAGMAKEHSKRMTGRKRSAKSIEITRQVWLGRKHTQASKDKISKANTGRVLTIETKEQMSKSHKGKKFTVEHKMKIAEAKQGTKNPNFKGHYHTPWGDKNNKLFLSAKDAAEGYVSEAWLQKACQYPDRVITVNSTYHSDYLTIEHVGKTNLELGFYIDIPHHSC